MSWKKIMCIQHIAQHNNIACCLPELQHLGSHFLNLSHFECTPSHYGVSWYVIYKSHEVFEYAQMDYHLKWVKLIICKIHMLLWINRTYNVMPKHLLFRLIWCRLANGHLPQKRSFGIVGWPELPVGIVPSDSYKNDLAGELVSGECFCFVMVFCLYLTRFIWRCSWETGALATKLNSLFYHTTFFYWLAS